MKKNELKKLTKDQALKNVDKLYLKIIAEKKKQL